MYNTCSICHYYEATKRSRRSYPRDTANRFDLTLQGGPNQHGMHEPRRTICTNHSPPCLELQDCPTIIWSAELNVRPPKLNICIPISPRLLDYPGGEMESCIFEVRQYSIYQFRLPPTPGIRLVHLKHNQQGRQRYGP